MHNLDYKPIVFLLNFRTIPSPQIMPEKPTGTNDSLESAAEYRRLCERKLAAGKMLDVTCIGGRRGGGAMLTVSTRQNSDVDRALGVAGCIIDRHATPEQLESEFANPRSIPLREFAPEQANQFWDDALRYADMHEGDTCPRLFGVIDFHDVATMKETRTAKFGEEPDLETLRKIDLPFIAYIDNPDDLQAAYEATENGDFQGIILRRPELMKDAWNTWNTHLATVEHPALHPRPFMGVRGNSSELLQLMQSDDEADMNVHSLIFTDEPTTDLAREIHELHLERMRKEPHSRHLENPFNSENAEDVFSIAIINVQGSARGEAAALTKASQGTDVNIDVHLVENGEQLKALNPKCIILPGGWHGRQYDLQKELGLNDEIVSLMKKGRHLLALCAGSILTRQGDDELDDVRSTGCAAGTSFKIGSYKVDNNVLNAPHDLHVAVHAGHPDSLQSRLLQQVPFSNGPVYTGVDEENGNMDVIARIRTDERATDINEDDGPIVGLQVKQRPHQPSDPVRMALAFHDKFAFLLFLNEVALYRFRLAAEASIFEMRRRCHEAEMDVDVE